jgi:hypothetical protein
VSPLGSGGAMGVCPAAIGRGRTFVPENGSVCGAGGSSAGRLTVGAARGSGAKDSEVVAGCGGSVGPTARPQAEHVAAG